MKKPNTKKWLLGGAGLILLLVVVGFAFKSGGTSLQGAVRFTGLNRVPVATVMPEMTTTNSDATLTNSDTTLTKDIPEQNAMVLNVDESKLTKVDFDRSPIDPNIQIATNLKVESLDTTIIYSLKSLNSWNEGLIIDAWLPTGFKLSAKTAYLYINGRKINADSIIHHGPQPLIRDRFDIWNANKSLRYTISPENFYALFFFPGGNAGLELPIKKIRLMVCDEKNTCETQDFTDVAPKWITVSKDY